MKTDTSLFDPERTYVFFKNNCPCSGGLYDDLRICDIKTGKVLFNVCPKNPWYGYRPCVAFDAEDADRWENPPGVRLDERRQGMVQEPRRVQGLRVEGARPDGKVRLPYRRDPPLREGRPVNEQPMAKTGEAVKANRPPAWP